MYCFYFYDNIILQFIRYVLFKVLYNLHLHPTDGTAKPQCHNDRLLDQQLDSLIWK